MEAPVLSTGRRATPPLLLPRSAGSTSSTGAAAAPAARTSGRLYRSARGRLAVPGRGPVLCSAEPDWDAEMSLFRKRTMRPNQLETLRKMEEEVDVGKVMYCADSIAIIEGLNNDAPIGTRLKFVSGAAGVLMWRRSDNICFGIVLGGGDMVEVGEGVQCSVKAILQVVDDAEGATTKREYDIFTVPAGPSLAGAVVDFVGRPLAGEHPLGTDVQAPLLAEQLDMNSREQINEPLVTGVKAVDCLTPLGRGQALLLLGGAGTGKSTLALDALLGQRGAPVRCFLAAVGPSQGALDTLVGRLQRGGAMAHTTVVAAPAGAPLGQRYAAVCAAVAMAERVRDRGGHALVVLDDIGCMAEAWERITGQLASLDSGSGRALVAQEMRTTAGQLDASSRGVPAESSEGELVEYAGMLVSAAAAQRRRFFSSLIQRSAKVHRRLGGGSLTMLAVLPGRPASNFQSATRAGAAERAAKYSTLTPQQKERLLAALAARQQGAADSAGQPGHAGFSSEVVEEFMSIADGQAVVERSPGGGVFINPQLSVSRIGSRAYAPAMAALAPQIRFELAQAVDARQFVADPKDPAATAAQVHAERLVAALAQEPHLPVPLEEQVVQLWALQNGFFAEAGPEAIQAALEDAVLALRRTRRDLLQDIAARGAITPATEAALREVLTSLTQRQPSRA